MTFLGEFFHYGFWGMALVEFGKFGLFGSALYSLFIILHREEKNNVRMILGGTAVASCLASVLMLTYIYTQIASGPVRLSLVMLTFIWLSYFIFIPQMIIFLINKNRLKAGVKLQKIAISRVMLTLALTSGLIMIHAIIGQYVFRITPD